MLDPSKNTPPQFFVEPAAFSGDRVVLTGDVLRHALTQRLVPGQIFRVVADLSIAGGVQLPRAVQGVQAGWHGQDALAADQRTCHSTEVCEAEVVEATRKRLVGKIINRYYVDAPSYALHLYPAILKGDKFDLVIVKATELGVTSITPIVTARTIPRLDEAKKAARKARWEKVSRAAAEQSGRPNVPEVRDVISFKELMADSVPGKALLALERREMTGRLDEAIGSNREVSILIGPEGGFEADEVGQALEKGFSPATLGPYILRAETASMAACAIIVEYLSRVSP